MSAPQNHAGPLGTSLCGIALRNPVILAAGTAGYIDEMSGAVDLSSVGAIVTKSITAEPREGNATWRIVETRGGMLNAIGLANVGAERFASEHAPRAAHAAAPVIGSIAGESVEGYLAVARMMEEAGSIPAVELNVSCPNVHSGAAFGETPGALAELVSSVRAVLKKTRLFAKLPPAVATTPGLGIVELARAAVDAGADAITIANTIPAMAIDVESLRPRLANITGGLSGPGIHPVAVRLVHLVHRAIPTIPLIAAGGVTRWEDAAEFILAGATAVQIGSALFADPRTPVAVARGLEKWVARQGRASIAGLIGAVQLPDPASERSDSPGLGARG